MNKAKHQRIEAMKLKLLSLKDEVNEFSKDMKTFESNVEQFFEDVRKETKTAK